MASKQDRYNKKAYDLLTLRVLKGKKEIIQAHAVEQGTSLNGYIVGVIEKEMQSIKGKDFSLTSKSTDE